MKRILESGGINSLAEEYFNIHWLITYNCTYNCVYCFRCNIKEEYTTKEQIDKTIDTLQLFPKKVGITLMGGEPLIHPNINYIIERLQNINNLQHLYIFTNLSLDIPTAALKFDQKNKIKFLVSYHPTFVESDKSSSSFKEKLALLVQNNIDTYVKLMLEYNYINEIKNMYEQLKSFIPSSNIHIIPLEPIEKQNYPKEYLDLERYVNKIDKYNTYKSMQSGFMVYYIIQNDDKIVKEIYTEEDMYKLPKFYHCFFGMQCNAGYHLDITPNGDIYIRCDLANQYKYKHKVQTINPENIQDIIDKPRICSHIQCFMRNDIRMLKKVRPHV